MKITGVVKTDKGELLAGARVTWTVDGLTDEVTSDHSGKFVYHDQSTQHRGKIVQLRVEHSGFKSQQIERRFGPSGDLEIVFELQREEPVKGIDVRLDRTSFTAIPGQAVVVRVELANLTQVADRIALVVGGLPTHWIHGLPDGLQLAPADRVSVEFVIDVPRSPDIRAAEYPLAIQVISQEKPGGFYQADARLTVAKFWAQALEIDPISAPGQSRAQYIVTVRNLGNAQAAYSLAAASTEHNLSYAFEHNHVPLDAGQAASVKLTITAPRRWIGRPREHVFTVTSRRIQAEPLMPPERLDNAQKISAKFIHNALFAPITVILILLGLVGSMLISRRWPLVLTALGLLLAFLPYRRESAPPSKL
jgi:hypothetical protein